MASGKILIISTSASDLNSLKTGSWSARWLNCCFLLISVTVNTGICDQHAC